MKKLIATLLTAALLLTSAALAETYRRDDLTFEYDASAFEIAMDDHSDDESLVILNFKDAAWGEGSVRIHLRDLNDGESFPTLADFGDIQQGLNTLVTQGDWAGFKDVFSYEVVDGENTEYTFIAPIYDDDDPEVEDILTVQIAVTALADEATAMKRDDAISEIVDTLKVDED